MASKKTRWRRWANSYSHSETHKDAEGKLTRVAFSIARRPMPTERPAPR